MFFRRLEQYFRYHFSKNKESVFLTPSRVYKIRQKIYTNQIKSIFDSITSQVYFVCASELLSLES